MARDLEAQTAKGVGADERIVFAHPKLPRAQRELEKRWKVLKQPHGR